MADTNVRIKLSADGKQVRDEIRLIDRDLQELGGSSVQNKGRKSDSRSPKPDDSTGVRKQDSSERVKQETRDRTSKQILREMTLLRKELQKYNRNYNSGQTSRVGNTQPLVNNPNNQNTSSLPAGNNAGSGNNSDSSKKLSSLLGKVGSVLATVGTTSKILSSLGSMAKSSQSGMSLAYQTYGSTLAYQDYNQARKDASNLGTYYGYDYETVMGAGSANMSKAGFTTLENYNTDMNQILKTSKAWGLDASMLSGTSGYMSSIGVMESGDQKKFTDLLAESIVQAEMTGREDEQLQVLEEIAETLANGASTVTDKSLISSLNMYNALVAQNENLKGSRGSQLTTSMQELATSGNTSLDVLAGFGTEFTGIEGKLELRKLAETDPEQYWKQVYQGYTQRYGEGNMTNFTYFLSKQLGSVTKAEDIVSSLKEVSLGTHDISDTTAGESATDERIQNYYNDKVSTLERKDVEVKEMKDDMGNAVNSVTAPFWDMYNNMSDGWKTTLGIGTTVGGGILAKKLSGKALGKLGQSLEGTSVGNTLSKLFGKSSAGTGATGAAGAADDVARAVAGSADDVAGAAGKILGSTDEVADVAGATGKALGLTDEAGDVVSAVSHALGSTDEAANALSQGASALGKGASALGKVGKVAGAVGIAAESVSTIIDATNAASEGDYRSMAKEIGGGVAGIAGGIGGGAATGALIGSVVPGIGTAIGGLIGGIVGGFGGDALGGKFGELIYDLNNPPPEYSEEQRAQLQKYYAELSKPYDGSDGNSFDWEGITSREEYLRSVVVPYLKSIDVSQSLIDRYTGSGFGVENFIKDFDKSRFGYTYEGSGILSSPHSEGHGGGGGRHRAVGEPYVPYDNTLYSLHKGEMVLTKAEADDYRQGKVDDYRQGKVAGLHLGASFESPQPHQDNTSENTKAVQENTEAIQKLIESNLQTGLSVVNSDWKSQNPQGNESSKPSGVMGSIMSGISGIWSNFKSHAVGNAYVPYDNYLASLHKGEMVLDKFEADQYRQGNTVEQPIQPSGKMELNINVSGSIGGMNSHNQDQIVQAVVTQISKSGLQGMLSNGFVRVQNY